jgi:hypothetical protein
MPKIPALPPYTTFDKLDALPIEDVSGPTTKEITLEQVLGFIYPVGSIYMNASVSTNPGTLLGFGTWTAHAAGRVNVGVGTSDQAFAAGATGGESNHTLTTAELAVHSHTWNSGTATATGGGTSGVALNNAGFNIAAPGGNAGSGSAHNNLQPYVVVYMWKRTA